MKTRVRFVYLGFSAVILGCFGFLPAMQAVSPAPDGAYSDLNTAEGQSALEHLIFGPWLEGLNTAIGWEALFSNAHGHSNTPNGGAALHNDTTGISNTDCRGRCKDRFASDHARRGGKTGNRALRSDQRNVAKRVPERTPSGAGTTRGNRRP